MTDVRMRYVVEMDQKIVASLIDGSAWLNKIIVMMRKWIITKICHTIDPKWNGRHASLSRVINDPDSPEPKLHMITQLSNFVDSLTALCERAVVRTHQAFGYLRT
jgi:hypothetical protein